MKQSFLKSWYVWIFPLCAVIICGILLVRHFQDQGVGVVITFPSADGINPGSTPIKYRGVTVGEVQGVQISEDEKSIVASVEIMPRYKKYAVKGSKFWLVEPQISLQGVSGLSTLRDGTYIAVEPGAADGEAEYIFSASGGPSSKIEDSKFSNYTLETSQLGALGEGDPIYYRGVRVGQIVGVSLHASSTKVLIDAGIQNRYAKLIRQNTQFWRKQAVQADVGILGAKIDIGSLETLMKGGIELAIPDKVDIQAKWGSHFSLLEERPKDSEKWKPEI